MHTWYGNHLDKTEKKNEQQKSNHFYRKTDIQEIMGERNSSSLAFARQPSNKNTTNSQYSNRNLKFLCRTTVFFVLPFIPFGWIKFRDQNGKVRTPCSHNLLTGPTVFYYTTGNARRQTFYTFVLHARIVLFIGFRKRWMLWLCFNFIHKCAHAIINWKYFKHIKYRKRSIHTVYVNFIINIWKQHISIWLLESISVPAKPIKINLDCSFVFFFFIIPIILSSRKLLSFFVRHRQIGIHWTHRKNCCVRLTFCHLMPFVGFRSEKDATGFFFYTILYTTIDLSLPVYLFSVSCALFAMYRAMEQQVVDRTETGNVCAKLNSAST